MSNLVIPNLEAHHFSISVPNMDVAITWYEGVLGFHPELRFAVAAINARGAFLRRGALRIELWQIGDGALVPESRKEPTSDLMTGGTKHVAFTVSDLQGCLVRLVQRGVDIAAVQREPTEPMLYDADPANPSKRPAFAAFIRDPAGTLIELLDSGRVLAIQPKLD